MTDAGGRGPLLEIEGLRVSFFTGDGVVEAVCGVDLTVPRGRVLCLVGESGCGKSVTARSILQLVDPPGRIVDGRVRWHEDGGTVELTGLDPGGPEMRRFRGERIGMVFQEPAASLSSMHTIGDQLVETIRLHRGLPRREAWDRGVEQLARVGIPRPERRMRDYPFQLSGGLCQRAMIAIALSCDPALLIADEPTTALDVTTQARILDLVRSLQAETGMSVLFITHDLGVVAEIADEVAVMYLGTVVERAGVDDLFHQPRHPYTRALLRSIPKMGAARRERLDAIAGMVPPLQARPRGCPFHPRCEERIEGECERVAPPPVALGAGRDVRCLLYGGERGERR